MHNSFLDGTAGIGPELNSDELISRIDVPFNTQESNVEDSNGEGGLDYDNEDYDESSEEEDKI